MIVFLLGVGIGVIWLVTALVAAICFFRSSGARFKTRHHTIPDNYER
jgi:hypothetical protein